MVLPLHSMLPAAAAAFAKAVERALNLPRPGIDGSKAGGDRVLGVVMGVYADVGAGHMPNHVGDDLLDLRPGHVSYLLDDPKETDR